MTKTPEFYDYDYPSGSDQSLKVQPLIPSPPLQSNIEIATNETEAESLESNEIRDDMNSTSAIKIVSKRSVDLESLNNTSLNETTGKSEFDTVNITRSSNNDTESQEAENSEDNKPEIDKEQADDLNFNKIPHFHVTYWMFYPFSQGKTMCTLNLGPLGPIPIPLIPIFNICLGTRKEFGSHVGDWEHISLNFKGRMEPDVRN